MHFTSTGAPATLPADYQFTGLPGNGLHTFTVTPTGGAGIALNVSVADALTPSITGNASLNIVNDAFLTPLGRTVLQFRPHGPVVVASFTDDDPTGKPADFAATIDWGDGTLTAGTVAAAAVNGRTIFLVSGQHAYQSHGVFNIKVTITDKDGSVAVAFSTARFWPLNFSFCPRNSCQLILLGRIAANPSQKSLTTHRLPSGQATGTKVVQRRTAGFVMRIP